MKTEIENCDRCGFRINGRSNMVGGKLTCDECRAVLIRAQGEMDSVEDGKTYTVMRDGIHRYDVPGGELRGWLGGGCDVIHWAETISG